jgi:hypothetical protein
MDDYRSVVDDLRSFLHSPDQQVTQQVAARAARYAQLCQDVNQRLRRCADLLRKGRREEALHLAKTESDLLELFGTLNFAERPEYDQKAVAYELPLAPRLEMETAQALEQARADAEPLADLLRTHRLLALGRAPLVDRLRVLRRLAEADPMNPLWPECLQTFEPARLRALETEAEEAIRKKDTSAITRLHAEVTAAGWLNKPPAPLVRRLTEAAQHCFRSKARQELVKVEKELNAAFMRHDLAACQRLRDQWDQLASQANLPPNDLLHEQAAPAIDWIARQEALAAADAAYEGDIKNLMNILKSGAPEQITHCLERVRSHARELPEDLTKQCRDRLIQLHRRKTFQRVLVLSGVAAVVLVVLGASFLFYQQGAQSRQAAQLIAHVDRKIQDRQLDLASDYIDDLLAKHPQLAERADVRDARQRLEDAQRAQAKRQQDFERALREERLDDAARLAMTSEDQVRVAERKKSMKARDEAQRAEKVSAFNKRLDELKGEVEKLDQGDHLPRRAGELTNRLHELAAEAAKLGPDYPPKVKTLTDRIASIETASVQGKRRLELEQKLDRNVPLGDGSTADYVATLSEFIREFPASSRTSDFKKALAEEKQWQALSAWRAILKDASDQPLEVDPKAAKSRAEDCASFLTGHADFLEAETARQYQAALNALAKRDERSLGSAESAIKRALNSPIDFKTVSIFTYDKKHYYTRTDVTKEKKKAESEGLPFIRVRSITDFQGGERAGQFFIEGQGARLENPDAAPQVKLADSWDNSAGRPWNERVVKLIEEIRKSPRLDPIAKYNLFKEVVAAGRSGGYGLDQVLERHAKHLEATTFDPGTTWIDPDNANAAQPRRDAQALLDKFPSTTDSVSQAARLEDALRRRLARAHFVPVGWLARDPKAGWVCRPSDRSRELSGDQELGVLATDGKSASWQVIGNAAGGKVAWLRDAGAGFVEGRLVFARPRGDGK